MKGPALLVAAFLAGLSVHESIVDACTTFCVKVGDTVIFGRNYDFEIGGGALIVNPRGLRKTGFLPRGPAWTSSYGSVTFNQFGRDFPMGGMNERAGRRARLARCHGISGARWPLRARRPRMGPVSARHRRDRWRCHQERRAGPDRRHPPVALPGERCPAPPRPSSFSTTACRPHWKLTPHRRVGQRELRGLAHHWRRKGESSLPGGSGSESRSRARQRRSRR